MYDAIDICCFILLDTLYTILYRGIIIIVQRQVFLDLEARILPQASECSQRPPLNREVDDWGLYHPFLILEIIIWVYVKTY